MGLILEDPNYGDYIVSFTAYNGATVLGTFMSSGNNPNSLSFIGLSASGGDLITSLLISDNAGNNLAFGALSFGLLTSGPGSGGGTAFQNPRYWHCWG